MAVKMGDAAAGGGTEIETDVDAVGLERGVEDFLAENDFFHQIGAFNGRKLEQIVYFSERNREQMTGVVGESVEDEIGLRGAMDDERGAIVA